MRSAAAALDQRLAARTELERLRTRTNRALERMVRLTYRLCSGGSVDSRYIREQFAVSRHTAHRDLTVLEANLPCEVKEHTNTSSRVLRLIRGAEA